MTRPLEQREAGPATGSAPEVPAALLRQVLENAPGGILVVSAEGRIVMCNQPFLKMWDLGAEAAGHGDDALLEAAAQQVVIPPPEQFLAELRASDLEHSGTRRRRLRLRDGRVFDHLGTPLHRDDGSYVGWTWFFRDVTDYIRAEAQLQRLADTLQSSLLPPRPPTIPGLQLATRYVPAASGVAVGGDFYDVFNLRSNSWGIVVGDVCGKGPEAAALTSLVRYSLRAIAQHESAPAHVLAEVNNTLLRDESLGERFAAVVYARAEQDVCGAWLTLSCGGHPLPSVVRRAGWVDARGQAGTVLGLFDDIDIGTDRVGLGPGDAMVFYTDGITEARQGNGELFLEEGLPDALLACAHDGCDAQSMADHLVDAARAHAGGAFGDDVAVLVVRVPPDADADERLRAVFGDEAPVSELPDYPVGEPDWGPNRRPSPPREARLRLLADPAAVPTARGFVKSVLHSWRMSDVVEVGDVELLTSEVVTNAVLHGASPFAVIVRYDGQRARVEVGDGSRVLPRTRAPSEDATTGRGLVLIESLAADWGTHTTVSGKRVWFEVEVPPQLT